MVLLTEPIDADAERQLREYAEVRVASGTSVDVLCAEVSEAAALIVRSSPLPADVVAAGTQLRVIGRHGAGTENVDVAAATARGIPVVNTPAANAGAVAEFVLLVVLTLTRRLPELREVFLGGRLPGGSLPGAISRGGLLGRGLSGTTLGLLGYGAIGRQVATLFAAHDVDVIFHDPYVTGATPGAQAVTVDELLRRADVISVHTPLTPDTAGLLNERTLARTRPGVVVVNTARAAIVDRAAMLSALDSGQVSAYAVDVFSPEPPPTDDELLTHPKVFATPHMAAMTNDAMARVARCVVDGVLDVLAGRRPAHVVNPEVYGDGGG